MLPPQTVILNVAGVVTGALRYILVVVNQFIYRAQSKTNVVKMFYFISFIHRKTSITTAICSFSQASFPPYFQSLC